MLNEKNFVKLPNENSTESEWKDFIRNSMRPIYKKCGLELLEEDVEQTYRDIMEVVKNGNE